MRVTESELTVLRRLSRRDALVLLAAQARSSQEDPTSSEALSHLSGYSQRHVLLALDTLERAGLVRREYVGSRKAARAQFRVQVSWRHTDPGDRCAPIVEISAHRSRRSVHTDRGDRSTPIQAIGVSTSEITSKEEPSVRVLTGRARTRTREAAPDAGRTDGEGTPVAEPGPAVRACVREHWPTLPDRIVSDALARVAELGATDRELAGYLRAVARFASDPDRYGAEPAFDGLRHARAPFGAALTVARLGPWLERLRAARRLRATAEPPPDSGDVMSPAELGDRARAALAELR